MENQFSRTETLLGIEVLKKLSDAHVAIFGLGGVGSYVVEALARVGIRNFDLIDDDIINITNINRQLIALHSTIGQSKVEVCRNRILDINPNCNKYDYVIDAIDSVSGKIELVLKSNIANVPIISSMGTGNKIHPEQFEITDIYKTSVCPLAKVMRSELKKRGIKNLKVLYSKEIPIKEKGQRVPASISFVPSVAGLMIAGEVVRDIIKT